ncbi:Hypothetical predicted protein [Octopus vulgaris]|uniref:Uncharacterized protein n=1 Tax=Octopus vulgaris TaxID=6645 RepID=A0AA36FD07_OCTVU|nr:Hypothetical predicted protein [Octopus vulgaris]
MKQAKEEEFQTKMTAHLNPTHDHCTPKELLIRKLMQDMRSVTYKRTYINLQKRLKDIVKANFDTYRSNMIGEAKPCRDSHKWSLAISNQIISMKNRRAVMIGKTPN